MLLTFAEGIVETLLHYRDNGAFPIKAHHRLQYFAAYLEN